MARVSTWEARLGAYIQAQRGVEYAYGSHDCGLFAAGAVEAVTGVDHGAAFRGRYADKKGAAKALRAHGAGTLEGTIDALFEPAAAGFVQRGDLVWNGEAVGVCMGGFALFLGDEADGFTRLERGQWVKGWRIV